ncbi:glycine cleavage system aminomethyltransferase GcvT [Amnibacterium flavum]|uniref:Aminomethyltransferase n=1 Tax=Amnibacterium flavum TaxID=2173173 RepID=A0A2V1HQ49_9MICO|nr:glycine cleavage system aminomethyltransferase GcvT [Amnibacterium flavum]PVZ93752.1 glycine cleavage system aminomethyltransferase GcvT [Amnibacterium flavum]
MTDTDASAPADAGEELLSPLHEAHVALGASFTDFAGWQMPVRYSSDLAEHHAVRTAAGLFDLSHMGEILVLGPDAAAALDYALAGRMSALDEGRAKYTLILTEAGGVIDDLIVYRTGPDRFLVVANASNREVVAETLRARADGFDALVEDESGDIALIAIQGPKSAEILANVEDLLADDGAIGDALDSLGYYRVLRGSYLALPVLIARTGYTGEDGFEIYIAPDRVRSLWDAILETGAGAGIVPAGLASRDTLRLEAGMPLYGHELGVDVLPAQAGLGRAVALGDDRDFVGRAAVESGAAPEPDSLLAGRVLVGLASEGRRAGRAGYRVFRDDGSDAVGLVTSGALSPTLGYPIAMAYVDPSESVAGTVLSIDVRGSRIAATVVTLPFYKRES